MKSQLAGDLVRAIGRFDLCRLELDSRKFADLQEIRTLQVVRQFGKLSCQRGRVDFDADGLPCPCAFVVCQDVESETEEIEKELSDLAAASLPRFKRPRRYIFVNELPYTATGKVQRFKLREMLRRRTEP